MAFVYQSSTGTHKYLWLESGDVVRTFGYVTDDAMTAVDASGYFSSTSVTGYLDALAMLKIGDRINVYVVTTFNSAKGAKEPGYNLALAGNLADTGRVIVVQNDGTTIDTSNELVAETVTDAD